ncbi:MAG: phosphomannomutase/phosphoglucomutase [Clostridia bacterium]|nr:phosphomannomutase/phosphoglucomutase [Clostridia bacterium]
MDYKQLKSGTDIRGTALDILGNEVNLTEQAVSDIAFAFGAWAKSRITGNTIAVGCDSRLSSPAIKKIVTENLKASGYKVLDCGLCSTPSMFMTTKFPAVNASCAVMITASHHPADKNGLKFFLSSGGLGSEDIAEIIAMANRGEKLTPETEGEIIVDDFMAHYCNFLVEKVKKAVGGEKPLENFKIVVDAGNGAGAFYVERVLKILGADTTGSQFLEPDGSFPNHIPNPENKTAMQAIVDATVKNNADLGIIFDTDVDRAAVVDSAGNEINRNRLIALISAILLKENQNVTIVTDSVTSDGLKDFIQSRGGKHLRFKRGYKNVIDEATRRCLAGEKALLAIETSGHAALKENYFLDDGAYLVTRIIIEMAKLRAENKTLGSLIEDLKIPVEELEIRLTFNTDEWKILGNYIIESVKKIKHKNFVIAPDNYEGVRVSIPALKGWFLIRMSVHDPIMPINIESDEKGGAVKIAQVLYEYLSAYEGLNIENLAKVIGK